MKEPPLHTALLSAANLLSSGGIILPKYFLNNSGCSIRAASVSKKRTPCFAKSSLRL